MALYEVTGPDGKVYEVEGPDGASDAQVIAAVRRQIEVDEQTQQFMATRDVGMLENILSGLGAGAVGTLESAALGGATLLDEEQELEARDAIKRAAQYVRPEGGRADDLSYKLASGVGSLGAFLGTALLGPAALPAAATLAVGAGAGEASERARAAGVSEDVRNDASLKGALVGTTEILPLGRFVSKLGVPILTDMVNKLGPATVNRFRDRVRNAAVTGGIEGAQEATAAVLQNAIEQGYNPDQTLLNGAAEEGGVGAFAGALLGLFLPGKPRGAGPEVDNAKDQADKILSQQPDLFQEELSTAQREVGGEQLDLFPETIVPPTKGLAPEEDAAAEEISAEQLDMFAPEQRDFVEELLRQDAEAKARLQREATPENLLLGYEPTRTAEVPKAGKKNVVVTEAKEGRTKKAEVPSEVIERARIQEQEARAEQEQRRAELDRQRDEGMSALQRVARQEAQQEELTRPAELPEAELMALEEQRARGRAGDEQLDMFTLQRELETLFGRPTKPSAQPTEQLEIPEVTRSERGQVQREMFGPRGGVQKQPTDTRQPAPKAGPQQMDMGFEQQQEQAEMLGPRGGVLRRPRGRPAEPRTPEVAPEVAPEVPRSQLSLFTPKGAPTKAAAQPKSVSIKGVKEAAESIAKGTGKGKVSGETKQATETTSDVQSTQAKPTTGGTGAKPNIPSAPEAGASVVEKPAGKPAGSGRAGLGSTRTNATTPDGRKESKPAPLKEKQPSKAGEQYASTLGRPLDSTVLDVTLPQSDTKKVNALPEYKAETKKAVTPELAAGMYFRRYQRPIDAMQAIAFDIANKMESYTKTGNPRIDAHFESTGKTNALRAKKWIDENLSDGVKGHLSYKIREAAVKRDLADRAYQRTVERQEAQRAAELQALADATRKSKAVAKAEKETSEAKRNIDALNEFSASASDINKLAAGLEATVGAVKAKEVSEMSAVERNKLRESIADDVQAFLARGGDIQKLLTKDSVLDLSVETHPAVSAMLKEGDLQGALYALSKTGISNRVRKAAAKLADKIGSTKVVVEKNLKDSSGNVVAGLFDPKTNTIKLNSDYAGNAHTILHETMHAVTSNTLASKSHPVTRQLQKLYEEVKDSLSTYYGAQSLDEFVAEVYTNPEFRAELSRAYPKEGNASAFRKVMDTLVNFFRKLFGAETQTKLTDDNLNAMIETIMAPAPNLRNAGELYMASSEGNVGGLMNRLGRDYAGVARTAKRVKESEFMDNTAEFFRSTAPTLGKKLLIASLPSQAAADQTARVTGSKKAYRLHELFEEQEGATNRSDMRLDATAKSLQDWRDSNPDKTDAFDRLVANSTIEEVDPSKPRSSYKDAKALEWDKLQPDWEAIKEKGQEQYTQLRDAYKTMYDELVESIETNLGSQARKVFLSIFPKQRIEPYFPLVRKGDHWLKYTDPNGEYTFEAFETLAARDRQIAVLQAEGATNIEIVNDLSKAKFNDVPSTSFVGQVIQIMQANKVDNKVIEDTMRLFVQMLPATSFAKSLQKREGVAGFRSDALFAFREKAYNLGRQVVQFKYSKDVRATMEELRAEVIGAANKKDATLDQTTANVIIQEWDARSEFAVNPPTDVYARMARTANRIAFLGTIGFSASSAIVNFSQLPLFVFPYLAGRTSFKQAKKNIYTAMKLFSGSGFNHRVAVMGANGKTQLLRGMPSIDNYYQADDNGVLRIRTDIDLDDKADYYNGMTKRQVVEAMLPLVQKAGDRGLLNRSLFYDTLGAEMSGKAKNTWDRVNSWSAFAFHTVERHNRQVTLVSNFLNELTRLKEKPLASKGETNLSEAELMARAVDNALYETQQTNGGAVLATAPRITQKGIMRVAMMYKTYGIQMYYTQLKTAIEAINRYEPDPEVRRIARRQLAGTTLAVLAMSGVQGLTLFGIAAGIANLFLDDDDETAETYAREYLGEGAYKGLLNQLTGVDVASRIGLSNLIVQSNRYNFDPSMEKTIVSTLGGPFYGYTSQFIRGTQDVLSGEVQRGVENMLPSAFRNAAKAYRYGTEGAINTRRGDPILDDLSYGDIAAQFVGFAPAEYTRNQERNQVLKGIERSVNETRTKLLRKYYIASRTQDTQGVIDVLSDIKKFNDKHPTVSITAESINRSMAQHMKTSRTMYNGVTLSPNLRAKLEDIGEGFE